MECAFPSTMREKKSAWGLVEGWSGARLHAGLFHSRTAINSLTRGNPTGRANLDVWHTHQRVSYRRRNYDTISRRKFKYFIQYNQVDKFLSTCGDLAQFWHTDLPE